MTTMSIEQPGVKRKRRRRGPEEARREALNSARRLLMDAGPNAITLKAVGDEIGVTHSNLIHHFGSAAGLQSALMGSMVRELTDALAITVARVRSDDTAQRGLIDAVFDAFNQGGAGRLAAWIALSGDLKHLDPVRAAVQELVEALREKFALEGDRNRQKMTGAVLFIALCAFGDAVIGPPLSAMLDRDEQSARRIMTRLLPAFLL